MAEVVGPSADEVAHDDLCPVSAAMPELTGCAAF